MRWFILSLISVSLIGCMSVETGMTLAKFQSQCKTKWWQPATEIALSDTEVVAICNYGGANTATDFQLFTNGMLQRVYSKEEVQARLEDSTCHRQYGVERGTSEYVSCRMWLAQLRMQNELVQAQQRQQAMNSLFLMGMAMQQKPQSFDVNIKANCIATQMGSTTVYNCQ